MQKTILHHMQAMLGRWKWHCCRIPDFSSDIWLMRFNREIISTPQIATWSVKSYIESEICQSDFSKPRIKNGAKRPQHLSELGASLFTFVSVKLSFLLFFPSKQVKWWFRMTLNVFLVQLSNGETNDLDCYPQNRLFCSRTHKIGYFPKSTAWKRCEKVWRGSFYKWLHQLSQAFPKDWFFTLEVHSCYEI